MRRHMAILLLGAPLALLGCSSTSPATVSDADLVQAKPTDNPKKNPATTTRDVQTATFVVSGMS